MTCTPITFADLHAGDLIATVTPDGDVLASGVANRIVVCKDHDRAVDEYGDPLARSDYPHIYRIEEIR